MDDEAGLIGEFADDFDRNGGGVPDAIAVVGAVGIGARDEGMPLVRLLQQGHRAIAVLHIGRMDQYDKGATIGIDHCMAFASHGLLARSEEHTSELQSLMRISYAVFCLKNKTTHTLHNPNTQNKRAS